MLGATLFRRLPRGLALADEGLALVPVLSEAFARIGATLERFEHDRIQEVVTLGCVGTFATGWLLRRLGDFQARHPHVDLRLLTNNNRVDIAGDGLDLALRFGDGSWHGTDAVHLLSTPLSPVCAPEIAARLRRSSDLARETLLRSYRMEEWPLWFAMAAAPCPTIRGPIFDSSVMMAEAGPGDWRGARSRLHVPARPFEGPARPTFRDRGRRRVLLAHMAEIQAADGRDARLP